MKKRIKKYLLVISALFLFANNAFALELARGQSADQRHQYSQLFSPANWFRHIKQDYINFYTAPNLYYFLGTMGATAIIANTNPEQSTVVNYYQDHMRSQTTDDIASVVKIFGDRIFAFVYLGAVGVNILLPQYESTNVMGQWGTNSIRAIIVGLPLAGIVQATFGGDRPSEPNASSKWRFVNEGHALSGHAFAGSVPFITAAMMTENKPLKASLYAASTLTGLSRINDNAHYLSQVIMGWMTGYLSVKAVMDTNRKKPTDLFVYPIPVENGVGLGVSKSF